jgi:hypothetical protein
MEDLIPHVSSQRHCQKVAPVREWDAVMSAKGELAKSAIRDYPCRDNVREEL